MYMYDVGQQDRREVRQGVKASGCACPQGHVMGPHTRVCGRC